MIRGVQHRKYVFISTGGEKTRIPIPPPGPLPRARSPFAPKSLRGRRRHIPWFAHARGSHQTWNNSNKRLRPAQQTTRRQSRSNTIIVTCISIATNKCVKKKNSPARRPLLCFFVVAVRRKVAGIIPVADSFQNTRYM